MNNMPSETDTNKPIRHYAFYAAVVVTIAVYVIILGQFLPHVVTGWTGSFGSRSIYAPVIVAGMWTGLLGMTIQFYRPTERVNAILLMPFAVLLSAAIGLATGTVFAMVTLILAAVSLVPLVLHPAGRSVLRFDRVASPNRLLVGLYAVGAIFLIVYGGQEFVSSSRSPAKTPSEGTTATSPYRRSPWPCGAGWRSPDGVTGGSLRG